MSELYKLFYSACTQKGDEDLEGILLGICSRCGRETYPLYSIPTAVSKVTHRLNHLEWTCRGCMTPKEEWLLKLRDYNLQQLGRSKEKITKSEYDRLLYLSYTSKFKCPIGIIASGCDGHRCPSKAEPRCRYGKCDLHASCNGPTAGCYDDYRDECSEIQRIRIELSKIWMGKIIVK